LLKNLIFDWSGTLVDDLPPVIATTNIIVEHYGKQALTREQFLDRFELPYTKFFDRYLPGVPLEELQALYQEHFPADGGDVVALPGSLEFLKAARARGLRLFILSSVPQNHWDQQAAKTGLDGFFKETWTGVVEKCAYCIDRVKEFDLDPAETTFIGDMRHDIEAGNAAGLTTIATLTGYEGIDRLAQADPDLVVRDLVHLKNLLESGGGLLTRDLPFATVGALIFDDDDRVLLVRTEKWSGLWGIAGGKIEVGETAHEALRRETLEETGLELTDIRDVCVQDCIDPEEFFRPAHFLLLNYVARRAAGGVCLNEEAEEFVWVTLDEGLAMSLNKPTRTLLERVRAEGLRPR